MWLISLLSLFQMHLHVTYQGLAAAATDSNRSVPSIHGKKLGLSYNPFHGKKKKNEPQHIQIYPSKTAPIEVYN